MGGFLTRKLDQLREVTMKSMRLHSRCLIFIAFVLFMVFQLLVLLQRKHCKYSFRCLIVYCWYCFFDYFLALFCFSFCQFGFNTLTYSELKKKSVFILSIKIAISKNNIFTMHLIFCMNMQNWYRRYCWF